MVAALPSELPKQANSGGRRLAEEFDAKTSLQTQGTTSCIKIRNTSKKAPINSKPSRVKPELRIVSSRQDGQLSQDVGSPLINASYSGGILDSPEKRSSRRSSFSRQNSEEAALKRQYSDSDSNGSQGASKSRRSSLAASPTKERKGRDWVITTADGGQTIEPDGLHFLLKTCELLDPNCSSRRTLAPVKEEAVVEEPSLARRSLPRASRSSHRRGSQPASPIKATQRQQAAVSELHQAVAAAPGELPYFMPEQDQLREDFMPDNHDDDLPSSRPDSDDEYLPRRASGRGAAGRSSRAAARAAAAAQQQQQGGVPKPTNRPPGAPDLAAAPPAVPSKSGPQAPEATQQAVECADPDGGTDAATGAEAAVPRAQAPAPATSKAQFVNGPCMNPDCEHPNDSPQWRKGPANAPVLCNACGTRWLRNGTLKPLVPRRGIRYKNKPRTVSAPPAGKTSKAVQRAQHQAQPAHSPRQTTPDQPASDDPLGTQDPVRPANCHQDDPTVSCEQYQRYCQLAAAIGLDASCGGTIHPPLTLGMNSTLATLSPSMLAALLVGSAPPSSHSLPSGEEEGSPVDHGPHQQGLGHLLQSLPRGGDSAVNRPVWSHSRHVSPDKDLTHSTSQVFQLQAMAGPQAPGSVFFQAAAQASPQR